MNYLGLYLRNSLRKGVAEQHKWKSSRVTKLRPVLRPFLRSLLFPYLALSVLKRPSGMTQRITPDALKLLYFRELTT